MYNERLAAERDGDFDTRVDVGTDNKNSADSLSVPPAKKKKPENVDLFAVDDRKVDLIVNPRTLLTVEKGSVKEVAKPSVSITNRGSAIEQQAELLRLEAEKEQIQIDSLRISNDKVGNLFSAQDLERIICNP